MADSWLTVIGNAARRRWRWLVGDSWKQSLARLAVVGAATGLAALLFVSAGLVPIAASQPHWPITRVLLHYAMIRGVQTQALGVEQPPPQERPLDDEAMVLKGAGHYASGCLACHGAPGTPRAEVVRHMEPAPPYLPPAIGQWTDRELFWIVRHGIKYTAMPAWPSQLRDDEVWAMVAFLRRLPGLDATSFRALAYGDGVAAPATGHAGLEQRLADCARCHGRDGAGRGTGAFPALAGQSEQYLLESLQAYARGERHSGVMEPVAAGLGVEDMRALARHYARLPVAAAGGLPGGSGEPASVARGEQLARRGNAAARVPACVECHGPGTQPRNPAYPRLAGQHPGYLALQLQLFKQGRRGGSGYAHIMRTVAQSLDARDIRDLAAWYGSLPAAPAPGAGTATPPPPAASVETPAGAAATAR